MDAITDEEIQKMAWIAVLYNSDKRNWWIEGAKTIRDLFAANTLNNSVKTIGYLLTKAVEFHELNPTVVEAELNFPKGVITKLMNDEYYTNSVPIILFKNLILSLHIPFDEIEAAMIPTFDLLVSKETKETVSKKPHGYALWENKEALSKYTERLKELLKPEHNNSVEVVKSEIYKIIWKAITDHLILHVKVSTDLSNKDRVQILCDEASEKIVAQFKGSAPISNEGWINDIYSELGDELKTLVQQKHFPEEKLPGYEAALWDLKVIIQNKFKIDLPTIEIKDFK